LGHRLSQVELAQKLGITQGTISRAERGTGDIRLGTLLELASARQLPPRASTSRLMCRKTFDLEP
jgi:transcriptional regulator with XRE-family HTH domain